MKLHHIPIVIIVLAFITLGLTNFLGDLGTNYGQSSNTTTVGQLENEFQPMVNKSTELQDKINAFIPEEGESSVLELPYKFIQLGWSIVTTFWRSVITLGGITIILGNALVEVGVPMADQIVTLMSAILIFIVVAILLYAFWKWKFED